jgi:hypothetical protein
MPIHKLQGPDGRIYRFDAPEGTPPEALIEALAQQLQANPPPPPQGGFFPAAKAGIASLQQDMAGLGAELGLRGTAGAQRDIENLEGYKSRTFKPESKGWMETPWQAFKETLGGSLPYMAAPLAAGAVTGPLGFLGTSAAQFTGSNLARQRDTGQAIGDSNLGVAAATAVPQAVADYVGARFIPGISKMLGVAPKVAADIAKQTTKQAAADIALATGKAATVEGVTEATQQYLERLQAGLSTMDPEAREEYLQSFIGGAVLGGTLGVPGRMAERGGVKGQQAAEQRAKDAEVMAQQQEVEAQEAAKQEAYRQTPEYLTDVEKRWSVIKAKEAEMKAAIKGLQDKEDRKEAHQAVAEFVKSDEYQEVKQEYKKARPAIEQAKQQQKKLEQQAQLEEKAAQEDPEGSLFSQPAQPPLFNDPVQPPKQGKPKVQDVVAGLMQNPERAKAFLNHEFNVQGLTAKQQEGVRGIIELQFKQQAKEKEKAFLADMEGAQAELQELPPAETPDTEQFIDNTPANMPIPEGEIPSLEYADQPQLDKAWEKALGGEERPSAAPDPTKDIAKVDELYTALRGEGDEHQKAAARKSLDMYAKEGTPFARELVRLRDEQDYAVADMLEALNDLQTGKYFGGEEATSVAGAFIDPDPQTGKPRPRDTSKDRLNAAGSTAEVLVEKAQQAKQRYVDAAIQEAEQRHKALGQELDGDATLETALAVAKRIGSLIGRAVRGELARSELDTVSKDIQARTREFVTPKPVEQAPPRGPQRIESGPLKRQWAKADAAQVEKVTKGPLGQMARYVDAMIDKARQRKDVSNDVRETLEEVKEAIQAGHVSRDLLDAARVVAHRTINGQQADTTQVKEALQALHDVQREDSLVQKTLPGMEKTAFEKGTPEEFNKAPKVMQGKADAAWWKDKLPAIDTAIEKAKDALRVAIKAKDSPAVEAAKEKVEGLQKEREEAFIKSRAHVEKQADEQRGRQVEAKRRAEEKRVEATRKREEALKKKVTGLGLEGVRRVEGVKEKIKTAEDLEKERAIREMQDAADAEVRIARRKAKLQPEEKTTHARGPVTRDKNPRKGKHLEQARRPLDKGDTVFESDEESQRRETERANAAAEAIKGKPGTALRDKTTRGKLETDRIALQEAIAQLAEAEGTHENTKKIGEELVKLWGIEKELEPYRELDVLQADYNITQARKEARKKKRARKETRIAKAVNERSAEKSRREKAIEELEEDQDAFDDLSGFADEDPMFRTSTPGPGMTVAAARAAMERVISKWKSHPDVEIVKAESELPSHITDKIVNPGTTPGVFNPKTGKVYLVAENLASEKDVALTIAHEVAGHFGLRKVMGDAYATTMKALYEGNKGVRAAADAKIAEGLDRDAAVEEVLAEQAETDPGLLKRLYFAIKSWLAKTLGVKGVSDAEVQQIVDNARRYVETGKGAATGAPTPDQPMFRTKPYPSKYIGTEPGLIAKLKGNFLGLGFRVQFVDGLAAADLGIQKGEDAGKLDSLQSVAAKYYMRMANFTTQIAGQFLMHGPVGINKQTDSYKTKEGGATFMHVSASIEKAAKAAGWDVNEAEHAATMLAIGQRASALPNGWARANAADPEGLKAEYNQVVAKVNANPEAKTFLNNALAAYKKYNDGLMDFLVETDVLTSTEAARLKRSPYVPFYRIEGGEVKLFAENEHGIRIGNIKDNPDLQQMLGDDKAILPIFTSAVQNTFMISRMGLRNKATKETTDALHKAGFVSKMAKGPGPSNADTVHYKVKGEPYWATIDSDMYGIPAKMIVMGMEGIKTVMPGWVKALGMPANVLRTMITRTPAYVIRQLIRDPVNAAIIGAVDTVPVANATKHMIKAMAGTDPEEQALMSAGVVSSNIYTGDAQDMTQYMKRIAAGQSGLRKVLNFFDQMALQADASTRASVYEDSKRKGMTEQEALFRAMEIQNFSRRGLSPGMQHLSTLIPFFNAQIQGMDVLYRSFKGDVPFADRLAIQRKLAVRGMMLAAMAVGYASLMQDDEDYKKARPSERYQNFFIRVPGVDDFVKIPIPFEVGWIFKALPEAIYDAAAGDTTLEEAAKGAGRVLATSIPGGGSWAMPAAVAPVVQAAFGQTTWGPIESNREKQLEPKMRYRENTSETAKAIGEYSGELGISPLMFEHFVRGYTGGLGLAALRIIMDPVVTQLRDTDTQEKASKTEADLPLVGGLFQRKEGRNQLDRAYQRMEDIQKAHKTWKELMETGQQAKARQYAQEKANELILADMAGYYRQEQGKHLKAERLTRADPRLTQAQKDERIKRIRAVQSAEATRFAAAVDRTARP